MNEQDQRVRDYYKKMSLPQERLEHLLNTETIEATENSSTGLLARVHAALTRYQQNKRLRWNTLLGAAAMCFVLLSVTYFVNSDLYQNEYTQRTVREVAVNHTTRLEPEFHGESLAMLDNSMQQLPFTLRLPSSIGDNYKLVGSRYCLLSGELAAHVKFKHTDSGSPMSLFVTSNGEAVKEVQTHRTTLEGIDVELWREGGLFFAQAQRS